MSIFEFLFGDDNEKNSPRDWDHSVFDDDRFRNRDSGNWVDWEDVSTGDNDTDGFEHPNFDEDGDW